MRLPLFPDGMKNSRRIKNPSKFPVCPGFPAVVDTLIWHERSSTVSLQQQCYAVTNNIHN